MKLYLASLGAGLLVGIIYSLLQVRSPAPPVVALLGLLGMLMGEQIIPVAGHLLKGESLRCAIGLSDCVQHMLGQLPGARTDAEAPPAPQPPET